MRVSSDSFRIIMIGLAVIAVSFQFFDQRSDTSRLLSVPGQANEGRVMITDLTAPEPNENFSNSLAEYEQLKRKVQRLETELKAKTNQVIDSEAKRVEHQQLNRKVERLETELSTKTKEMVGLKAKQLKEQEKVKLQVTEAASNSQGREILKGEEEALRPKSCSAIMQRMHDWNDCWRRHMMTSNGRPWDEKITCPIQLESNDKTVIVSETIGAPLYSYAFYAGQGFGVLVQHTTLVCMLAFLLKRPCVINISPRDPYNNWGSFIAEGSYDWSPSALQTMPEYANQLEVLVQKLPKVAHGIWGDAINESDYVKSKSHVFPMNKAFSRTNWDKTIEYYSGTDPDHGNQVLVSPNWGDAWSMPFSSIFENSYGCDSEGLTSALQNAMYRPTHLTWQLHQERYERADANVWNPEEKSALYNASKNRKDSGPLSSAVLTGPHLSSTTGTAEGVPTYGTIHIRSYMITRQMEDKKPMPTEKMTDVITSCMERAQQLIGGSNFPTNWWFIADNAPTAVEVTEEFQKRQNNKGGQSKSSLPVLRIFNDYREVATKQLEKSGGEKVDRNNKDFLPSSHSLSKDATGLYGHEHLAGSIIDWMALHESKISIVTGDTSYGTTGSRGNGKSVVAYCGAGKADDSRQLFKILIEKKEPNEKATN